MGTFPYQYIVIGTVLAVTCKEMYNHQLIFKLSDGPHNCSHATYLHGFYVQC